MNCNRTHFSGHAIQRMFQRSITRDEVLDVIRHGETIIDYPDDRPYPSCLRLAFVDGRPIHAVVAFDQDSGECYVITAYDPDPDIWDDDFKQRKQQP